MNFFSFLQCGAECGRPARVGTIGAGEIGSMFRERAPTIPGLGIAAVADFDVAIDERARRVTIRHEIARAFSRTEAGTA